MLLTVGGTLKASEIAIEGEPTFGLIVFCMQIDATCYACREARGFHCILGLRVDCTCGERRGEDGSERNNRATTCICLSSIGWTFQPPPVFHRAQLHKHFSYKKRGYDYVSAID